MNWQEHAEALLNALLMLLMNDNPEIVRSFPPNIENMNAIELGAGLGRFAAELCEQKCKSIFSIDFVEKFTHYKAKEREYYFKFDFVFSRWLMMDDLETRKLAQEKCINVVKWMDVYFFVNHVKVVELIFIIYTCVHQLSEIIQIFLPYIQIVFGKCAVLN